mgnify:CR=1 FL=1
MQRSTPESILWIAVINQCLLDLETSIRLHREGRKSKFSVYEQCYVQDVLNEAYHPYMKDICDNAGVSYEKFLQAIDDVLSGHVHIKSIMRHSKFKKKDEFSYRYH